MDDVAEQLQVSNEMSDLISSPIGGGTINHYRFSLSFNFNEPFFSNNINNCHFIGVIFAAGLDFDESELMKELEDLEQEELNSELLEINISGHKLPEVPAADIKEPIIANKNKKCKELYLGKANEAI